PHKISRSVKENCETSSSTIDIDSKTVPRFSTSLFSGLNCNVPESKTEESPEIADSATTLACAPSSPQNNYSVEAENKEEFGSAIENYYKVGSVLGEDGVKVAVKIIPKQKIPPQFLVENPNGKGKIPREFVILQKLDHSAIIKFIEYFETATDFVLITELHGATDTSGMPATAKHQNLASFDLFELIGQDSQCGLDGNLAKKIFAQIVLAVEYLQEQNLVHRDLKDENIVVDNNGTIKIIDFGSAAEIPQTKKDYFTSLAGTLNFASPEILRSKPYRGTESEVW
ncbi:hypothetical protein HDU82_005556, partial [Entophlyctis luteolus]